MVSRVNKFGISIDSQLYSLIAEEILPGTGIDNDHYWSSFAAIIRDLAPINHLLLVKRDQLQVGLDSWYRDNPDRPFDSSEYKLMLRKIGYLVPEGKDFIITTDNVDDEIACIAGPQLVVPVSNARFAINAANARWGSLYDALYGTDAIAKLDDDSQSREFNITRAEKVIDWTHEFLDYATPLKKQNHRDVREYQIITDLDRPALRAVLADGSLDDLRYPQQFIGYRTSSGELTLLLVNHGLHIELVINASHPIGKLSPAGVKDVILESALTTIQDCEDSVAAVDAGDKVHVYRNWLGLMKGTLREQFQKGGQTITRVLAKDREYTALDGKPMTLVGRSLMLVRNVGHLMMTDAILDSSGNETPEGIMDLMVTALAAIHDIKCTEGYRNSRKGSIYVVKPKMHGPEEAAFSNMLFDRVEDALGLVRNTIKIGLMDEERRTTINLKECIREVKDRLVFINTGFLDRTGDEIHTSMAAGAFLPKEAIKNEPWITAYENNNVDVGLLCGLSGKAQIGKGMWAQPDAMSEMLATKHEQLLAGASCAWVPSPTAATLHATHYHRISVSERQKELVNRPRAKLDDILVPPLLLQAKLSTEEVQRELDSNAQSLLGYVVRWIDQGVGCSKVADINHVNLMEDRATLRISSQQLANWLRHGLCTEEQMMDTLKRMAVVVDKQNAGNPAYVSMAPDFEGLAFKAACALILKGAEQPNGYTEPLLHVYRRRAKSRVDPAQQ